MYLIHEPNEWASDKEWSEFLAKMMKLPQDDPSVQRAVERAQDELDLRSGKVTRAEIMARRDARLKAAFQHLREAQAAGKKEMQEKNGQQEKK